MACWAVWNSFNIFKSKIKIWLKIIENYFRGVPRYQPVPFGCVGWCDGGLNQGGGDINLNMINDKKNWGCSLYLCEVVTMWHPLCLIFAGVTSMASTGLEMWKAGKKFNKYRWDIYWDINYTEQMDHISLVYLWICTVREWWK